MRPPRSLVLSLALGTLACSSPFPCTRYCWSHRQVVPDVTDKDMTGMPDGRIDATCTNHCSVDPALFVTGSATTRGGSLLEPRAHGPLP